MGNRRNAEVLTCPQDETLISQLRELIGCALEKVYKNDFSLIEKQAHERTIVARFFVYFCEAIQHSNFSYFNCDFEYNRNLSAPKRTDNSQNGTYPDVILHQRGTNENNICAIEFKTWWNNDTESDAMKLKELTSPNQPYKYKIGYSIVFGKKQDGVEIKCFKNGECCDE